MIKFLLFDVDDTLLDFKKGELFSLKKAFNDHNINVTDDMLKDYIKINKSLWKKLELNEITKQDVLDNRFKIFFQKYNIALDPIGFEKEYRNNLSNYPFLMDGCLELLNDLKESYEIYLVTNGVKETQVRRLSLTGVDKLVRKAFISEEIGYNKPDINFFNYVFKNIPNFKKEEALIIGDSLSSDIKGGINAGIKTVYFMHDDNKDYLDNKIDYVISHLFDIYDILRKENQ
ncbi:MAG: YjjG family noncanonical pyrimidine nucleotidase [Bacilli bacterium]|nr:YjjG family noncanonical pyrimidine nucleotidase [Bacilli bacterium]